MARTTALFLLLALAAPLAFAAPIHNAAWKGNVAEIRRLLDEGADVNAKEEGEYGASPLAICCVGKETDRLDKIKLLLDRGADVNALDKKGTPIICYADTCTEAALLLLNRGADINAKAQNGSTILLRAARNGNTGLMLLLLERGADANPMDSNGYTPLMYAVVPAQDKGSARVVKLLLEKGANISLVKPTSGMTILQLGKSSPNPEVRELMCKAEEELHQRLDYCLKDERYDTDALIASKNIFLPKFLSTATNEQKVSMLMVVEKRIAKAKVRMGELNEQGRESIRKGKDGSKDARRDALQVGAYLDVIKEIKTILEGS